MIHKTFKPVQRKTKDNFQLTERQKMLLVPIGDIHFGASDWPEHKFKNNIQWALDRGAYFVGMGDYFDLASETQRKQFGGMRDSVREQIDEMLLEKADNLAYILEPTKGRWLGMIEGNHRWDTMHGTSIDQRLCKQLNCDFLGTSGLIHLKTGKEDHFESDCRVYVHHGVGAPRSMGASLNRLIDLLVFIDADICLMGHSHDIHPKKIDRQSMTPDGIHYHQSKLIARTGSWMLGYVSHAPLDLDAPAIESRGNYPEQGAMAPTALGFLTIGIGYEQIKHSKYYRPTIHYSA
jgi:hypothetical protein